MNIAIRKFYYGDIPEDSGGSNELKDSQSLSAGWRRRFGGGGHRLAFVGNLYPQQTGP